MKEVRVTATPNLFILYSLKQGVTRGQFETWVRATDQPSMRSLARVQDLRTCRTEGLLMGEGKPGVADIEAFAIPELYGFVAEDMGGETVQSVIGAFMGLAEAPQFILVSEVKQACFCKVPVVSGGCLRRWRTTDDTFRSGPALAGCGHPLLLSIVAPAQDCGGVRYADTRGQGPGESSDAFAPIRPARSRGAAKAETVRARGPRPPILLEPTCRIGQEEAADGSGRSQASQIAVQVQRLESLWLRMSTSPFSAPA